jgi:hypothetical protein
MNEPKNNAAKAGTAAPPKDFAKPIGVSMALLGVALALCSAMVGRHSTQLIRTMVEQSNRIGFYHTETMKFRVAQGNYEVLKSITPKPDEIAKIDATLRKKRNVGGAKDSEDAAETKDLIASAVEDMADLVTPDPEETVKFRNLARRFERDMKDAREDAEAYGLKIEAHREGAEGWGQAQLLAEIGIVIASVALLLANKKLWALAVVVGACCLGLGGVTYVHTRHKLAVADERIRVAMENVVKLDAEDVEPGANEDKKAGAPAKH